MTMNDDQLAEFLGIKGDPTLIAKVMASLTPEKRALYDRMAQVAHEAELWAAGLCPKPSGVLIDTERSTRRRKGWQ